MRLTRQSRYAIEALLILAERPGGTQMEAREIAEAATLPAPYLAKILQQLTGDIGILEGTRGQGYRLARSADAIRVEEVLRAIEGDDVIWETCIFWREECDADDPCPLHFRWQELKPEIQRAMGSITLAEVRDRWPAIAADVHHAD
jgi:Rrf2 family protein